MTSLHAFATGCSGPRRQGLGAHNRHNVGSPTEQSQPCARTLPCCANTLSKRFGSTRSRGFVAARAFTRETEALWEAFRLTPEEKERVWFAAYDAPYHGQGSGPYRCEGARGTANAGTPGQPPPQNATNEYNVAH